MDPEGNIHRLQPDEKVPVGNFKLTEGEAEMLEKIPKADRVGVLKASRRQAKLDAERRRQQQVHRKRLAKAAPHSVLPKSLRNGKFQPATSAPEARAHHNDPRDTKKSRLPRIVRKVLRRIGEKSRNRNR